MKKEEEWLSISEADTEDDSVWEVKCDNGKRYTGNFTDAGFVPLYEEDPVKDIILYTRKVPEDKVLTKEGAPGMPVEELAEHIKEQLNMPWKDVCKRLLVLTAGDLQIQRQMLEEQIKQTVPKPLQLLVAITKMLGWGFVISTKDDNPDLNGLIIGNKEYLEEITKMLEE